MSALSCNSADNIYEHENKDIVDKSKEEFRNYQDSDRSDLVNTTYRNNHINQTVEFVKKMRTDFCNFKRASMTIWNAIEKLVLAFDESDPDADFAQIYHAFQTAEALRLKYPDIEWLPLVGLIHDLGKVMLLPEFGALPQWAVVGDIYPVGCEHSSNVVKHEFFRENKDVQNPEYNTKYGMYEPHCGLDKLSMAWGHDQYMYEVCVHNGCTIPSLGLDIIRYHSFYSWHKDGAYEHFMSESDYELRKWCHRFSKCDLYSKSIVLPSAEEIETKLRPYYQSLIDKYFPNRNLEW